MVQLKDKDKIEGAYLLLKRYKNRLKVMDAALQKIDEKKSDRWELKKLSDNVDPSKQISIFNDMKELFDITIQGLEQKRAQDLTKIEATYDKLVREQRRETQKQKADFTRLLLGRVNKIEKFVNELALE